jgi:Mlc titration factor MtfA (ptsG expression regulator)
MTRVELASSGALFPTARPRPLRDEGLLLKSRMMFGFFQNRHRRKLLAQPLPQAWREMLDRNVAVYALLPPHQQRQLEQAIQVIVAERSFVGCGGLDITDEIKVTIAAQAALLVLGEPGYFFDRVQTIFVHRRPQHTRMVHDLAGARLVEEDVPIEGQLLEQGEIRLVWKDVLYGGRDPADGNNVVLHELAHHLDRLDGEIDGVPPLPKRGQHDRWVRVFDRDLAQLRRDLDEGNEVFLHEEAADSRSELFAYATECYFEQPHDLGELHPELFGCLLEFYRTDPREWFVRPGGMKAEVF